MSAASKGYVKMVRLLLEAGADPNQQDDDGSTALMYAAVQGHEACACLLLEHPKCNPRIKDNLSGSVSRFHATGPRFKPRTVQGRLKLSSLQWNDK
ncbi:KN motif and ankyrin repeat domain-containing protein 1 [Trichonephila clavipes]|nr:KN motif and ankyrin repeat domain-containing protein 1 [Trichonephila clavipes]